MESKLFKSFTPFLLNGEHAAADIVHPNDLHQYEAEDPVGSQWRSLGFIVIEDDFTFDVQGRAMLCCVQISERILPGAVLREKVNEKVNAMTDREGRRPGKKQIAEIKDDVVLELLPKAFIRRKLIPVMFVDDHMLIFSTSAKVCDDVITLFVRSVDAFPKLGVSNLEMRVKNNPPGALTSLAKEGSSGNFGEDETYACFQIANAAVLKGEGKKTVRIKDKDMGDSDMQALLEQDYSVTALRVDWLDAGDTDTSVTLTVNEHLVCSAVVLADVATSSEKGEDAKAAQFMSVAWLTAMTTSKMLGTLVDVMGGLNEVEKPKAHTPKRTAVASAIEDDEEL